MSENILEVIPVLFLVVLMFFLRLRYGVAYYKEPGGKSPRLFVYQRNLEKVYLPFLVQHFPFYNALNGKNKRAFEKRVQRFIDLKRFVSRGGMPGVTPEMKALIAGSAIQLTFGYPSIYFRHFRIILIYPDTYYSTITRKYHKGEVNLRGLIVVSWRNLKEGFRDHKDGHHLGLHEMAHALRLINIINNPEYDFYDRYAMDAFDQEARGEIERIRHTTGGDSIFRNYGLSNVDEFFAISVELFFECPDEFRESNPKLYYLLLEILRIDPVSVYETGEFSIRKRSL